MVKRAIITLIHVSLILLISFVSSPVHGSYRQKITIYVTDFGINQWESIFKTGNNFARAHNQVFPNSIIPPDGQIMIAMPDIDFTKMTPIELQKFTVDTFNRIQPLIDKGIKEGITAFDIQVIQNINTLGYPDSQRQMSVNIFGSCAYGSIGMVNDYLQSIQLPASFYSITGSNGCKVFTENIHTCKSYMKGAWMYDGRAFYTPTKETIQILGPENVHIHNTRWDHMAPNNPFRHSIGNFDVVTRLRRETGVNQKWLHPLDGGFMFGAGHVRGMTHYDAQMLMKQSSTPTGAFSKPIKIISADILPQFHITNAPQYRQLLQPPRTRDGI
jgi:hypothetical protein